LYYKHLKDIKDPQSRVYCTIASYNTGSSNVARAFGSSTKISQAINEINSISSEDVYVKLINDLPYDETKKYIARVKQSMEEYAKMLQKNISTQVIYSFLYSKVYLINI
jgi:membrane-bound lytic murein transglycosylase C